ncbi:hypothetical protein A5731_20970 [Mycolicibacterium conceptionense]|uniref:Uncharacterized protein n=3 Tax=Mycobacteriaceae TaxID=1762 RepID=A0ABR5FMA8_9MYCO|nr:hypothetical protein AA982_04215 [Mycolicibacterium senegalense]OBB03867.1 hypothetical protein A5718_27325 [Mycolicibacterium conceptionense]SIM50878.1 Uncharacterised protein [Mycobacteroides abscessus subsp. abscessus]KLO47664.1 hypothetical protein ABW05_31235 [Mycolicibacterium senegalense]OBE99536.1 hypothetical protein A5731_20970 [Mycolicibacterium conceptionense]
MLPRITATVRTDAAFGVGNRRGETTEGRELGMWQESDSAVGDLLTSRVLGEVGQIDAPVKVSSWWADHGITIDSSELNRDALFALAARCRERADADWVSFLWHVLAWGVMGDFRNAPTIVASAASADQRVRLNEILRRAAEASHLGEIRSAYTVIRGKVPRLGSAFFSKFLYFTGDRSSSDPSAVILDSRVSAAAFTLTGRDYSEQNAAKYEDFCIDMHKWSQQFETPADVIEFRMYQFGQLIDSRRWKWLHAEASLYREGCRQVGFDDIAERRAHLAGWTK